MKPTILFAEDDENDWFFFEVTLRKIGADCICKHVPDGEAAIDYLSGAGAYSDRAQHPFPAILITDLKMPKVSGFELLAWIQKELTPGSLPAIVLSGSVEDGDRQRAKELGAKEYWVKPADLEELSNLLKSLFVELGALSSST